LNPSSINAIPEKVEQVEKSLAWLIRCVIRGGAFRRIVFLLVVFSVFAAPPVVAQVLAFLNKLVGDIPVQPPSWWPGGYWAGFFALFTAALIVGVRTLPKEIRLPIKSQRGLLPFTEDDRELFEKLGRGSETQLISAALCNSNFRFGVLIGSSGAGKTSFLRAGILASLRARTDIAVACIELTERDALAAILASLDGAASLADFKSDKPLVLLIDQFEQFFVHSRTKQQRAPLIEALSEWYKVRQSPLRILISVRAEDSWHLADKLQEALGYQLSFGSNQFRLKNFTPEQAVKVFGALAAESESSYDQRFLEQVVEKELCGEDGLISPVDLQIVLLMLAAERGTLTAESFRERGGVDGLLEGYLELQLEAADMQGLRRAAILCLLAITDRETQRRAGQLTIDQVRTLCIEPLSDAQAKRALEWLCRRDVRLAMEVSTEGEVRYQLAHERLIPAINRSAGRVLEPVDKVNALLEKRSREWASDRSQRYLLSAAELLALRRHRAQLVWGENKLTKESLVKASWRAWRFRVFVPLACLVALLTGYGVYPTNPVQRFLLRRDFVKAARVHREADLAPRDKALLVQALWLLPSRDAVGRLLGELDPDESVNCLLSVAERFTVHADFDEARSALAQANNILFQHEFLGGAPAGVKLAIQWAELGDRSKALEVMKKVWERPRPLLDVSDGIRGWAAAGDSARVTAMLSDVPADPRDVHEKADYYSFAGGSLGDVRLLLLAENMLTLNNRLAVNNLAIQWAMLGVKLHDSTLLDRGTQVAQQRFGACCTTRDQRKTLAVIAWAWAKFGDANRARAILEGLNGGEPCCETLALVARALAGIGDVRRAGEVLGEIEEHRRKGRFEYDIFRTEIVVGEERGARAWLLSDLEREPDRRDLRGGRPAQLWAELGGLKQARDSVGKPEPPEVVIRLARVVIADWERTHREQDWGWWRDLSSELSKDTPALPGWWSAPVVSRSGDPLPPLPDRLQGGASPSKQ
jgi:hypothetical protein